jgi:filamentous hemagglutinin
MPFGTRLKSASRPTNIVFRKQRVYEVTEDISGTPLQKGDLFYLDPGGERNHLEIFNGKGKGKTVLKLDGTIYMEKVDEAQRRIIKL